MSTSPRGIPIKETIRLGRLRKVMAQTMKASVDTAALSQVNREIDVTPLQKVRRDAATAGGSLLSLNTLIMAAVARVLPNHPLLNAELIDNQILVYDTVNLGMAVAVPDGLIVVVIPAAEDMAPAALQDAVSDRAERARTGKLAMEDVEGGTFTVSNLGMFGIDGGLPLPRPPEGAILLVGEVRPKPWVVNGEIAIREIARFSLSFDHRFIDGASAARFLSELNDFMAAPASLLTS